MASGAVRRPASDRAWRDKKAPDLSRHCVPGAPAAAKSANGHASAPLCRMKTFSGRCCASGRNMVSNGTMGASLRGQAAWRPT